MSHGSSTNSKILSDLGKCLLEAARFGNTEEVRNLMSNGAPLITDWLGTTPLHLAAIYGHSSTAEILIKSGISRDCRTKVDKVPLHFACQHGHLEIVKILVEGGAQLNAVDMLQMSPLHWAVEANNFDICLLLLKAGVQTALKNKFNKTALAIAQDKGYGPIEKLFADDKFKLLQDIAIPRHNAFIERSMNAVKICRPEDIGNNIGLWKKPKIRRFPMVAGTWTGGESQIQERLDINERKKLNVYKRRAFSRDELVTPFLCGLQVPPTNDSSLTTKEEINLTSFVSPINVPTNSPHVDDKFSNAEGSPLERLKETVLQSTCPINNSALSTGTTTTTSTSPGITLLQTPSLPSSLPYVTCNVSATMSISYVTTTQPTTSAGGVNKNTTIKVPKMTTSVENVVGIQQRPYLGNIPVVSSLVLNSLPPDIKAIPLNMTVDELYKQQSIYYSTTTSQVLCLPQTSVATTTTASFISCTPKETVLMGPKKRPITTVSSPSAAQTHLINNAKKIVTEIAKSRTILTAVSSAAKQQHFAKVGVTSTPVNITASPVTVTTSIQTTATTSKKNGAVKPTIPVNIPVNMLKEILGGVVTLHSVPVKSSDADGSMHTLAGITTEMGTIPLIPVSGEGGLQLIPIENSTSQQMSATNPTGAAVKPATEVVTSPEKVPVTSTNPTYYQQVLPAQHFLQAPSPYFVQPQVIPYPYPVAASSLGMLPGYDIANALLNNRHTTTSKVSENGSIPTLPVHPGTPSPVLMPTGIYLQPGGHPSYYQMGATPTLQYHPPTYPQFVSAHSQQAAAFARQIHPTFLQQHHHPHQVLVQASGQPTIIQQQMPRYVYLDPGGAVVSQVPASATTVSSTTPNPT